MSDSLQPHGLYSLWNSPGQNTGVGSLSLLQGIFPTQGSNPGLQHCRWILYQLSHSGLFESSFRFREKLNRQYRQFPCIPSPDLPIIFIYQNSPLRESVAA